MLSRAQGLHLNLKVRIRQAMSGFALLVEPLGLIKLCFHFSLGGPHDLIYFIIIDNSVEMICYPGGILLLAKYIL